MPRLGYGVYQSPTNVCKQSVLTALQLGYRHVDTAQFYGNEVEVGEAIKESGIPRKDIYVVTKMMRPASLDDVEANVKVLRDSVAKIDAGDKDRKGYVDLFLIHSPTSGPRGREILWKALEQLKDEGGTIDIGVSNYGVEHLTQMENYAKYKPVCNQIELHPFCQAPEVVSFCESKGIILTAYSPIVRNRRSDDPTIVEIASKHGKLPTQVMIKWSLQRGFVPLPKSDNPERMKSNMDMDGWALTDEEVAKLNGLDEGEKGAICPYRLNVP